MRHSLTLFLCGVLLLSVWPVAAQGEQAGLLDTLLGGGAIRENIVYREWLGDDDWVYEATIYGSRVQGIGYLEFSLTDIETGQVLGPQHDLAVSIINRDRPGIRQDFDAVYRDGTFLVDDIDFAQSGVHRVVLTIDDGESYSLGIYVYPSAPDAPPALIAFSLAAPLLLVVLLLGSYRLFNVRYLPEPLSKNDDA